MKKIVIIGLLILTFANSCKKDIKNSLFNGITETNEFGDIISIDETDWNLNENWNKTENSLFSETFDNICNTDNEEYVLIAYPNPCSDFGTLHFSVPENKRVAFRIVDSDYKVLISDDSARSEIAINFQDMNVNNKMVRVYYKIYGDSCELKGHGDIRVD